MARVAVFFAAGWVLLVQMCTPNAGGPNRKVQPGADGARKAPGSPEWYLSSGMVPDKYLSRDLSVFVLLARFHSASCPKFKKPSGSYGGTKGRAPFFPCAVPLVPCVVPILGTRRPVTSLLCAVQNHPPRGETRVCGCGSKGPLPAGGGAADLGPQGLKGWAGRPRQTFARLPAPPEPSHSPARVGPGRGPYPDTCCGGHNGPGPGSVALLAGPGDERGDRWLVGLGWSWGRAEVVKTCPHP